VVGVLQTAEIVLKHLGLAKPSGITPPPEPPKALAAKAK